jgi:hypothetical protein
MKLSKYVLSLQDNYFSIKRRMVELDAILKARPEDKAARNELRILKNEFPLAWAEVQ